MYTINTTSGDHICHAAVYQMVLQCNNIARLNQSKVILHVVFAVHYYLQHRMLINFLFDFFTNTKYIVI